jgi:drug/metabolite transporter (DMT)-like permease
MLKVYLILMTGVIIVSSSSILIRWTGDVPFAVIAFYRVFISFCILISYQVLHPKRTPISVEKWRWPYVLAGFFLAAHFITWIASVQMTTIANAIFLGSMHPLFGVLASIIFLREFPHRRTIPVFILAFIGMFIIVYTDLYQPGVALWGDFLAFLSALFFAFYLLIARMHKGEPDFIRYLTYIYGSAAFFSMGYILLAGDPLWGFSIESWIFIILLTIGPNLLGHSTLNWASRHLEIFKVNLLMLLEPVLATIGGIVLIAEFPPDNFYFGAGLILLALGYLFYRERRPEG